MLEFWRNLQDLIQQTSIGDQTRMIWMKYWFSHLEILEIYEEIYGKNMDKIP